MENRRGELLVGIGVVLLFVGPMLNFYDIDAPGFSVSGSGYDADEGSTYVLAGIVALIGLAMAWMLKGGGRKAGGIVILLAGLFAAYAGYVDAFTSPGDIPAEVEVSHGIGAVRRVRGGDPHHHRWGARDEERGAGPRSADGATTTDNTDGLIEE